MTNRGVWAEVLLAVGIVYALALMYQMVNEFFDGSAPRIEETTVIEKRVRYNPVPIRVLTVRNKNNLSYDVDVLSELADKVSAGSELRVVRQEGFFGKSWVEDQEFHTFLDGTRTIQGFIYVAFGAILAGLWLYLAQRRFRNFWRATATFIGALVLAFGLFWILP